MTARCEASNKLYIAMVGKLRLADMFCVAHVAE